MAAISIILSPLRADNPVVSVSKMVKTGFKITRLQDSKLQDCKKIDKLKLISDYLRELTRFFYERQKKIPRMRNFFLEVPNLLKYVPINRNRYYLARKVKNCSYLYFICSSSFRAKGRFFAILSSNLL